MYEKINVKEEGKNRQENNSEETDRENKTEEEKENTVSLSETADFPFSS